MESRKTSWFLQWVLFRLENERGSCVRGRMCSLFSATALGDKRRGALTEDTSHCHRSQVLRWTNRAAGKCGYRPGCTWNSSCPQMQCLRGLRGPHFPILEVILTLAPLSLFLKVNFFYSSRCAKYVSPQTGAAENRAAVVERHKSVPPAGFQLPSVRIIVQENSDVKVVLSCFFF